MYGAGWPPAARISSAGGGGIWRLAGGGSTGESDYLAQCHRGENLKSSPVALPSAAARRMAIYFRRRAKATSERRGGLWPSMARQAESRAKAKKINIG